MIKLRIRMLIKYKSTQKEESNIMVQKICHLHQDFTCFNKITKTSPKAQTCSNLEAPREPCPLEPTCDCQCYALSFDAFFDVLNASTSNATGTQQRKNKQTKLYMLCRYNHEFSAAQHIALQIKKNIEYEILVAMF